MLLWMLKLEIFVQRKLVRCFALNIDHVKLIAMHQNMESEWNWQDWGRQDRAGKDYVCWSSRGSEREPWRGALEYSCGGKVKAAGPCTIVAPSDCSICMIMLNCWCNCTCWLELRCLWNRSGGSGVRTVNWQLFRVVIIFIQSWGLHCSSYSSDFCGISRNLWLKLLM